MPDTYALHSERPEISSDPEVLVLKGLEKEPERRYGSAAALADGGGGR